MKIFDYEDNFQTYLKDSLEDSSTWLVDKSTGAFTMTTHIGILGALAFINQSIKSFLVNTEDGDSIDFTFNGIKYRMGYQTPTYFIEYKGRT